MLGTNVEMKCGMDEEDGVFVHQIGSEKLRTDSDQDFETLLWDHVINSGGNISRKATLIKFYYTGEESIQYAHSLVLNCSDQNIWTLLNRNLSDFLKIPCVNKTKCVAPRNISMDTILQEVDDENAQYSCKEEWYLNFSSLNYPNSVAATCKENHIFENTLPFWDLEVNSRRLGLAFI